MKDSPPPAGMTWEYVEQIRDLLDFLDPSAGWSEWSSGFRMASESSAWAAAHYQALRPKDPPQRRQVRYARRPVGEWEVLVTDQEVGT